jgi:tRNA G10  N-methylase Trm11
VNGANIQGQVSPSDIAELAGVSRGAVSNWRKRFEDFPEKVSGTDANPLFDQALVMEWLTARGHEIITPSSGAIVWSMMNLLRGAMDVFEAQEVLLTLMAAKKIANAQDPKLWELILSNLADGTLQPAQIQTVFKLEPRLTSVEPIMPSILMTQQLREVANAISQIPDAEFGAASDYVLEKLLKLQGKFGADSGFVGSRTSTLLALLALQRPKGRILYDPACGIASALIRAGQFGAEPREIIGQDISPSAIYVARLRSYLHNIDIKFLNSDVLRDDRLAGLKADTIILEPPFGLRFDAATGLSDMRFVYGTPPKSSADLAWIQDAISHLSDTGRAYVLTPMGTLAKGGAEQIIRTGLIRAGCVEAIVSLPGKMLPHTAIPLALWVLRRPTNYAEEKITFFDASEETIPEQVVPHWLNKASEVTTGSQITVFASEVMASGSNLLPQNWVFREPAAYQELEFDYSWSFAKVEDSLQESEEILDKLRVPTREAATRIVTVEELLNQGVVKMQLGRTRVGADTEASESCFTNTSVRKGILPSETSLVKTEVLTSAGDVVVATMNATTALMDPRGGHQVASGLHHFTQFNEEVLLPAFFAQVISGSWNKRFQAGAAIQRASIKSLEIPLPPIEEQKRLTVVIAAALELENSAKELLANATDMRNSILVGIRYGIGIEVVYAPPLTPHAHATDSEQAPDIETHDI